MVLLFFIGLLRLLALVCDQDRRDYVAVVTGHGMVMLDMLLHWTPTGITPAPGSTQTGDGPGR
jgi:hypothetical protein